MADSRYLQELTNAEVRSNEIISKAHGTREKRIKEAKFDAEQDVAKLRQEMEEEFNNAKEESEQVVGADTEYSKESTAAKIQEQQDLYDANKSKMEDFLIEQSLRVDLKVPAVVKGKFD